MLKSMGVEPTQMLKDVDDFRKTFQEMRSALERIEAQNKLILARLGASEENLS